MAATSSSISSWPCEGLSRQLKRPQPAPPPHCKPVQSPTSGAGSPPAAEPLALGEPRRSAALARWHAAPASWVEPCSKSPARAASDAPPRWHRCGHRAEAAPPRKKATAGLQDAEHGDPSPIPLHLRQWLLRLATNTPVLRLAATPRPTSPCAKGPPT